MMNVKRLVLILALSLGAAAACGDDSGPDAVTRLHVDLGAVVEQGTVSPVDGITAAGQPDEAAFRVFAEQGYVAVIDLRTPRENRGMDDEPAFVEGLGMEYVNLPINGGEITMDDARELARLIDAYDGPVLVHCASSNRVGSLLALIKADEGVETEAAIEFGRSAGLKSLEDRTREVLRQQ